MDHEYIPLIGSSHPEGEDGKQAGMLSSSGK